MQVAPPGTKETKSLLCGMSVGRCMGRDLFRWRLDHPLVPDGPICGELVGHRTLSFNSASMNVVAFTSCPVRQFLSTQEDGSSMASWTACSSPLCEDLKER